MTGAATSPQPRADLAHQRAGIVTLLMLSAAAVAVAPLMLPGSYSWVRHAISESAAQGVVGAWVARLGLLLLGEPGVPFDQTEDLLHSVAATGMGIAFAIGVVLVTMRRPVPTLVTRPFDIAAIAASALIPLGMSAWPHAAGLLQRCMFTIAYLWYGGEALRRRDSGTKPK
jgi:hypothetical protein